VADKRLDGITAMRNETSREGRRLVLELRPADSIPRVVLNQLYKHTPMQSRRRHMLALVPMRRPGNWCRRVMGLKEILGHYIAHRHDVVVRRAQFELDKAQGTGAHPRRLKDRPSTTSTK